MSLDPDKYIYVSDINLRVIHNIYRGASPLFYYVSDINLRVIHNIWDYRRLCTDYVSDINLRVIHNENVCEGIDMRMYLI